MADPSKVGTDWTADELDLIVASYFTILEGFEVEPRGFKAKVKRELDAKIGRGEGSIDFKLGNLAFVAGEVGLPRLPGFKPAPNVQDAIYPAFGRYLATHPEVLSDDAFTLLPRERGRGTAAGGGGGDRTLGLSEDAPPFSSPFMGVEDRSQAIGRPDPEGVEGATPPLLLTETPPPGPPKAPRAEGLARLVRKYDPAARDHANRRLGLLGEERVFHHERARLIAANRPDLARRIEWTSQEHGDGAGYDIKSFDPSGAERLIEVKATRGGPATPFWLTRTEREVSLEHPAAWRLYRLHDLSTAPGMFVLPPPLEASVRLEAETWRAGF